MLIVGMVRAFLPCGLLPRKSVAGEVVLITGAGSGLGRLMAQRFAQLGSRLVLWDINQAGNEQTAKMIEDTAVEVQRLFVRLSLLDRNALSSIALLIHYSNSFSFLNDQPCWIYLYSTNTTIHQHFSHQEYMNRELKLRNLTHGAFKCRKYKVKEILHSLESF